MYSILKSKWQALLPGTATTQKFHHYRRFSFDSVSVNSGTHQLQEIRAAVLNTIGGLDDLESNLNKFAPSLTSSLVVQVVDSCKTEAPTRRLLRFFLWSHKNLKHELKDKDYNHAIRVFARKKDYTALNILISDLQKDSRALESQTYGIVAEALVMLGREDEALRIFKNLDKLNCPQDRFTVAAIVNALCARGHAKKAEGVVLNHKDKLIGIEQFIYKSLLYGWCEQENVQEAGRIIKEMKSAGTAPDLFCYNTFLRCVCEQNLKQHPSGLFPEALNVMMEMRSYMIAPNSISYNILLSSLVRSRRVKESCQILDRMKKTGCSPDKMSYYLVAKVFYLTKRFDKGNMIVDEMIEEGLVPDCKFYYGLIRIICRVESPHYALELFERMKRNLLGGYGPVYDMLIPKLCRGGGFEKGKELWDEAMNMGVNLRCSSDVLDPSITVVFKPTRNLEEKRLRECMLAKFEEEAKKKMVKAKKDKKKKKKIKLEKWKSVKA